MTTINFDFSRRVGSRRIIDFANILKALSEQIGFKVSARGWCYLMEQAGLIDKSQFDKVEGVINRCRKQGLLPVDFTAEDEGRAFKGVERESDKSIEDTLKWMLRDVLEGQRYYTPNWWKGEEYYIQTVVEKIDLRTLFAPVCAEYHIPIANSKGWSSIRQRATYCRRFQEAEEMGLKCVLLYCGDHDPDGLRISETLRKNLEQVSEVVWSDGVQGYDPSNLIIERFGINYDFIQQHGYTWIPNLITGNKRNLASPKHPNFKEPYVQEYLATIGIRKCEANVIVTTPEIAQKLMRDTIENYVGSGALERFQAKRDAVIAEYERLLANSGVEGVIRDYLEQ